MRIFILEDDIVRKMRFEEWFGEEAVDWAESCTEIDNFKPPYDVIFLDHDLGGRQLEDHEDNGHAFAKLIVPLLQTSNTPVVVHSFSPDGAQNIEYELRRCPGRCYIAPFLGVEFRSIVGSLIKRTILR